MTLRVRLVAALLALVTVGLGVFGVVTYSLYARTQYERLDEQLRSAVPMSRSQLERAAASPSGSTAASADGNVVSLPAGSNGTGYRPGPPGVVPPFAELVDGSGTVVERLEQSDSSSQPVLPTQLPAGPEGTLLTASSTDGSGDWRVFVDPGDHAGDATLVVALPLSEVTSSLHRLVLIEAAAASVLLAGLGTGAWLILRRGLRPLEHMADRASSIRAGDLSGRVSPSDPRTEIGQLGLALNTMLGEIEAAFAEREATERRLRQFLADASHELRTPLTSIQGFAELSRLGADRAPMDGAVMQRRIEEEAARMKVLVEDLLLLARLDETRPADRGPVDLRVVAADACSDAAALDPSRPITLDAPEPVVVDGDEDHLRQAVGNLVANAVAHTPPGTALDIIVSVHDGWASVQVADRGPGLDDDALLHVFDRFWRADGARVGHGTGLGLSIVAGIASEHGGVAHAANRPGGGAEFTFALPVVVRRQPRPLVAAGGVDA